MHLQIFGFHTPCCYSGQSAFPEPASQECKVSPGRAKPTACGTSKCQHDVASGNRLTPDSTPQYSAGTTSS